MRKSIIFGFVLLLIWSSMAAAGRNYLSMAAIHVLPHAERTCADGLPDVVYCSDFITTDPGNSVDAFPVFFDMVECERIDYALEWLSGVPVVFTSCSDHCQGTITNSGDGVIHTWDTCVTGPSVIPGWIWIEGPISYIYLLPNPETGGVWIYDCLGQMDNPCYGNGGGMGGMIGDDPCVPVDPSGTDQNTWSAVKAMFQ